MAASEATCPDPGGAHSPPSGGSGTASPSLEKQQPPASPGETPTRRNKRKLSEPKKRTDFSIKRFCPDSPGSAMSDSACSEDYEGVQEEPPDTPDRDSSSSASSSQGVSRHHDPAAVAVNAALSAPGIGFLNGLRANCIVPNLFYNKVTTAGTFNPALLPLALADRSGGSGAGSRPTLLGEHVDLVMGRGAHHGGGVQGLRGVEESPRTQSHPSGSRSGGGPGGGSGGGSRRLEWEPGEGGRRERQGDEGGSGRGGYGPPSLDDEDSCDGKGGKKTRKNYKNMTRERRVEANARERSRVHTISAAFESLRRAVPSYSYNQKLSKLAILRIASSYIMALHSLTEMDYNSDHSGKRRRNFADCVDSCTQTIQTEGRARRRH